MSTWPGWENEFLTAANINDGITTPPNRQLLTEWANHTSTNCGRNPIDLSVSTAGSRNCAKLPNLTERAQRYPTHAQAAQAFNREIHQSWAANLLKAMNTGNPYQVKDPQLVADVFTAWGSLKMYTSYLATQAGSAGNPGSAGASTGAHKGWSDLRKTINHTLPGHAAAAHKLTAAALHRLERASKVRG